MKIYLVEYNNMECWEDSFRWIPYISSTFDGAKEYIDKQYKLTQIGKTKEKDKYGRFSTGSYCIYETIIDQERNDKVVYKIEFNDYR